MYSKAQRVRPVTQERGAHEQPFLAPFRLVRSVLLTAAVVLIVLTVFALRNYRQLRPEVRAAAEFDRRGPFAFAFEISNHSAYRLHRLMALCNISLVADDGKVIEDTKVFATAKSPITLDPASRRAYVCRANFKNIRPGSVHLAVLVRYEQDLMFGHPWRRTVWVPFHILMDGEKTGHWLPGEANFSTEAGG